MRPYYSFAALALASATSVFGQEACRPNDVIESLRQARGDADSVPDAADATDGSIHNSSPVVTTVDDLIQHFADDLDCRPVVFDSSEQRSVCDQYISFAEYQKESIDTGLSDDFMTKNLKQPNANKVHALTSALEVELTSYTNKIKETVPSCADEVENAFGPLEEDLNAILAIYSASEAPQTQ